MNTLRPITNLLVLMLFLCSCNVAPHNKISDTSLIREMTFESGSYFVYYDSITHATDSFYSMGTSTYESAEKNAAEKTVAFWEGAETLFTNARDGMRKTRLGFYCGSNRDYMDKVQVSYDAPFGYSGICLKYPFSENEDVSLGSFTTHYQRHYESLLVAGRAYHDVYCILSESSDQKALKSYFSSNDGLIRFILIDSGQIKHDWCLTWSNIIR